MLDVMRRQVAPLDGCRALGDRPAVIGHQRFDRGLELFGQLRARSAEHLDAVVLVGMVRRRDDQTGIETFGPCQVGDGRRGHHAGAHHSGAFARQPARQLFFDPRSRFAGVAANYESKPMALIRLKPDTSGRHRLDDRGTDTSHRLRFERSGPRLAANAIRSKQLHGCLGPIVTVTTAVCGVRSRKLGSGTPIVTTSRTDRVWSCTDTGSVTAARSRFSAVSGPSTSTDNGSLVTRVTS